MLGAFALFALFAGQAPPTAPPPDLARLGPQVGEQAPDFTLTDQSGHPRNLKSVLGRNGAMLVFVRSADW